MLPSLWCPPSASEERPPPLESLAPFRCGPGQSPTRWVEPALALCAAADLRRDDRDVTLEALQVVIEQSHAEATAFTASLFDRRWKAREVQGFVNRVRDVTIATVLADGSPHASPTITACLDGTIYFAVHRRSATWRNLQRDRRIAFTVSGHGHAVLGWGVATFAGSAADTGLISRLASTGSLGWFTPEAWKGEVFAIETAKLFAS